MFPTKISSTIIYILAFYQIYGVEGVKKCYLCVAEGTDTCAKTEEMECSPTSEQVCISSNAGGHKVKTCMSKVVAEVNCKDSCSICTTDLCNAASRTFRITSIIFVSTLVFFLLVLF